MIFVNGKELAIPKGDTGSVVFNIKGTFSASDYGVFTIAYNDETPVLISKKMPIKDNQMRLEFKSEDTNEIASGNYLWDLEIVRGELHDTPITHEKFKIIDTFQEVKHESNS